MRKRITFIQMRHVTIKGLLWKNFFKKLLELGRLLGYNTVYNNLEKKNILVLKMHQWNVPLGMQNFKITWGDLSDPPSRRETPSPLHTCTDTVAPHLCFGYFTSSYCYFFTRGPMRQLGARGKWSEEFIYKLKTLSLNFTYFCKGMQHLEKNG